MAVFAFLVILVGLIVWFTVKDQIVFSTAPAVGVQVNIPVLRGTSAPDAQEIATADILLAHDRATFSAATSTQNAAQTQVVLQQTQAMLQQTQAQFSLRLTADSATERAGATATQQQKDDRAASTTTAIAGVIATQTQSVIAAQQERADQARQSEAQQQDTIAFLWAWGPPLFLLAVVAGCIWAFWYWEIRKRGRRRRSGDLAAPVFADPAPALAELPLVVIDPVLITEPDGQVSGWLEEVKEKLLAGEKEEHGNPNA